MRFEYTTNHNDINYGAVIDVHGGRRNYALYCIGGLKVNGSISTARYAPSDKSDTIVLNIGYRDTFVFSTSTYLSVYLPSRSTITKKMGEVHPEYGDSWSEVGFNSVIFVHVIVAKFSSEGIRIEPENSDTPLLDNNGNSMTLDMNKGDCATFAYFNQDGIYSIDIINYNANNHKNIQYGTNIKRSSININTVLPQFDTRKTWN